MRQGIQSSLANDRVREEGCYFLCLLQWAVMEGGRDFADANITYLYGKCLDAGYIRKDCTILFAHEVLNAALLMDKYLITLPAKDPGTSRRFVQYLEKPGYGHFTLSFDGQAWDPLDPNRLAAKDYRPVSYRLIS